MKLKKIIASILAMVSFTALASTSALAEDNVKIYYSVDNSTWECVSVSDFESTRLHNRDVVACDTIDLGYADKVYIASSDPDNTKFYQMNVSNDDSTWGDMERHFFLPIVYDISGVGSFDNAIAMPLRNGDLDCVFKYNGTYYQIPFTANDSYSKKGISVTVKHSLINQRSGVGRCRPLSGASVQNDNASFIDPFTPYNDDTKWNKDDHWVAANFSKYLVDSAYVMMPVTGIAANNASFQDLNQSLISISASKWEETDANGYAGEVVVLLNHPVDAGSKYTPENGWECVNNGTIPQDFILTSTACDWNDYSEKYFAAAYNWKTADYKISQGQWIEASEDDSKAGYRAKMSHMSDGISGKVNGSANLCYAYRKQFKAGDSVDIYNPGGITSSEASAIIIPIVKFYEGDANYTFANEDSYFVSDSAITLSPSALPADMANAKNALKTAYSSNSAMQDYGIADGFITVFNGSTFSGDTQMGVWSVGFTVNCNKCTATKDVVLRTELLNKDGITAQILKEEKYFNINNLYYYDLPTTLDSNDYKIKVSVWDTNAKKELASFTKPLLSVIPEN